ncbi:hypothetical protein [Aridibaculum aurantiacum]|uniref:hypothetical protein n=1 Tax=Aridibaculum aurantiacum TaxID=2810307 RepID=UPI001A961DFA|nr:hypothetical protein [Aridibaculum aurantiacum]
MRTLYLLLFLQLIYCAVDGQTSDKKKLYSIAVSNSHSSYPFSTGVALVTGPYNPGFELAYNPTLRQRQKHEWVANYAASYLFHRFNQHAISLYAQFGYRYKFTSRFHADGMVGGGYLHSIPATAQLKLNEEGEYENAKGIRRMQATVNAALGIRYYLSTSPGNKNVFLRYQTSIQTPFVKSYVPMLPYNTLLLGVAFSIQR